MELARAAVEIEAQLDTQYGTAARPWPSETRNKPSYSYSSAQLSLRLQACLAARPNNLKIALKLVFFIQLIAVTPAFISATM